MDRTELVQLHAALEAVISWPDNVRAEVARWLSYDVASMRRLARKRPRKAIALKTAPPQMGRPSPTATILIRHAPHRQLGPPPTLIPGRRRRPTTRSTEKPSS